WKIASNQTPHFLKADLVELCLQIILPVFEEASGAGRAVDPVSSRHKSLVDRREDGTVVHHHNCSYHILDNACAQAANVAAMQSRLVDLPEEPNQKDHVGHVLHPGGDTRRIDSGPCLRQKPLEQI